MVLRQFRRTCGLRIRKIRRDTERGQALARLLREQPSLPQA
jgi:hypothetical protein